MPLIINSKHSTRHNSIEELYTEDLNACKADHHKERYIQMIQLSRLIDRMFATTEVWALTSIGRLVLMNQDDWKADWLVIISNDGGKGFSFKYLVPIQKAPWKNAYMEGDANSLEEAKIYLLRAMKESGGWSQSEELRTYCEQWT